MTWGHLKAADFINLIEGNDLTPKRRAHLQSCAKCTEAFVSAQNLHSEVSKSAMNDDEIPEPDWFQFRADVRNAMLSRAAQRQAKAVSWQGWWTKPALSWGLAVAFAAGLSAGLLMWNRPAANTVRTVQSEYASTVPGNSQADVNTEQLASLDPNENVTGDASLDFSSSSLGITPVDQFSIFDEISQLNDAQAEKLQRLVEKSNEASTRQ